MINVALRVKGRAVPSSQFRPAASRCSPLNCPSTAHAVALAPSQETNVKHHMVEFLVGVYAESSACFLQFFDSSMLHLRWQWHLHSQNVVAKDMRNLMKLAAKRPSELEKQLHCHVLWICARSSPTKRTRTMALSQTKSSGNSHRLSLLYCERREWQGWWKMRCFCKLHVSIIEKLS